MIIPKKRCKVTATSAKSKKKRQKMNICATFVQGKSRNNVYLGYARRSRKFLYYYPETIEKRALHVRKSKKIGQMLCCFVLLPYLCTRKTKGYGFALPFIGALVQLVRIHACHAWGHGFESRTHRKPFIFYIKKVPKPSGFGTFLFCIYFARSRYTYLYICASRSPRNTARALRARASISFSPGKMCTGAR